MINFEIVNKPIRTLMTVDNVEVVLGQKYDIALQSTIKLENETGLLGEPFDAFSYKIHQDDLASTNTGVVTVNFETDKTQEPTLVDTVKDIPLSDSFYFSSVVAPSQYYDRIKINSFSGKGYWTYNGNPIVVGQVIFYYQLLNNLQFVAGDPGVMTDYSNLKWETGTILGYHSAVNNLDINSTSLGAELILVSSDDPEVEAPKETYYYNVSIKKSIPNAVYKIEYDTTNFPSIGTPEIITINERDLAPITIETLGVTVIDSTLDANGQTSFYISIEKEEITTVENSITITLKEVALLESNVNPAANTITLIIPITILTP